MRFVTLILIICLSLLASAPIAPAQAQTTDWTGACIYTDTDGTQVATLQGIECLLGNVLSVAIRLIGIVMFIMIVVGGVRYLASGGDPKAVDAAKGMITMAIIGLVMAILSWFVLALIAQFTLNDVTSLTNFKFPNIN